MTPLILVIEDSASVRRLIEVCARPLGVRIVGAEDGLAGLELAAEHRPDLVILDIGLPTIDGWEVLRRLRADPPIADIPVLIVTAHAQPELAAAAERRGADGFMTKPFRPGDLRATIAAMLERGHDATIAGTG